MKFSVAPISSMAMRAAAALAGLALFASPVASAQSEETITAPELAARMNAARQSGSSLVRLRMEINRPSGAPKTVLQLQAKERHSANGAEVVFQVLWPKERKGEAVLLRRSGRSVSGAVFNPPDTLRTIGPAQMREPFFGSDLAYEDLVENFFTWDQQSLGDRETVNGAPCQVLVSKPGKGERSSYGMVKTWIDMRRLVPMRVEKYSPSGDLVRRIDTTRVLFEARTRHIPVNFSISGPGGGASTEIDGSRVKRGVKFSDEEFTPEGLRDAPTSTAGASE